MKNKNTKMQYFTVHDMLIVVSRLKGTDTPSSDDMFCMKYLNLPFRKERQKKISLISRKVGQNF